MKGTVDDRALDSGNDEHIQSKAQQEALAIK